MLSLQHTQPIFQASWTPENVHLKINPANIIEKIGRIVWNIISVLIPVILLARIVGWGVAALAKKATLPSAIHYSPAQLQQIRDSFDIHCFGQPTDENRQLRSMYTVERHTIQTPDQESLSAVHFRHRSSGPDTPTILYFQPNLALSEQFIHSWLLDEAMKRNIVCNFVAFDYRSVSLSRGELKRPEDLIVDGDAAYQFVNRHLGVPPHLIKMYGWSLGGCVSANVKAIHPECRATYVNERSFSETSEVVRTWLRGFSQLLLFWLPFAMKLTGWNLKTPIHQIQGPIMIAHHPSDSTIHYDASCHQLAIRTHVAFESVKLKSNHFLEQAEILGFQIYHHAHPLRDYVVAERGNCRADRIIADFLLGPPVVAQTEMVS